MALQDPAGEENKRATAVWLESIAERKYLLWFFQQSDFGPADGEVREMLEAQYEKVTGCTVPQKLRYDTGE